MIADAQNLTDFLVEEKNSDKVQIYFKGSCFNLYTHIIPGREADTNLQTIPIFKN